MVASREQQLALHFLETFSAKTQGTNTMQLERYVSHLVRKNRQVAPRYEEARKDFINMMLRQGFGRF